MLTQWVESNILTQYILILSVIFHTQALQMCLKYRILAQIYLDRIVLLMYPQEVSGTEIKEETSKDCTNLGFKVRNKMKHRKNIKKLFLSARSHTSLDYYLSSRY